MLRSFALVCHNDLISNANYPPETVLFSWLDGCCKLCVGKTMIAIQFRITRQAGRQWHGMAWKNCYFFLFIYIYIYFFTLTQTEIT